MLMEFLCLIFFLYGATPLPRVLPGLILWSTGPIAPWFLERSKVVLNFDAHGVSKFIYFLCEDTSLLDNYLD
jgi:hypothetical protein